jgi:hypothetical protein
MSGLATADRATPPFRTHTPDLVVGLIGGLVAVSAAFFASDANDARMMLGTLLAGIGFVYVGFAVSDGRVSAIEPAAIAGIKPAGMDALRACLKDEGYGLRLREHRDTIAVTLKISAKP